MDKTHREGLAKYRSDLINSLTPYMQNFTNKHEEQIKESLRATLLNEKRKNKISRVQTQDDVLVTKLFFGFSEIEDSFQLLQDIPIYLKRFPALPSMISKTLYLRFHIGSYLNEVYILQQRLKAYSKQVFRMYRPLITTSSQENAIKTILTSFQKINHTRGSHVHERHYSDDDFDRLNTLKLLATHGGLEPLKKITIRELREVKQKWISIMANNVEEIEKLLNIYFEILHSVVFIENGIIWKLGKKKKELEKDA